MACSHSGLVASVMLRTGAVLWQTTLPDRVESSPVYHQGPNTDPLSHVTRCTAGCDTVLVGCYDHHLYSLDFSDGSIRWAVSLGGLVKCSALLVEDTLVCGSYESNLVVRLHCEDGEQLWSREVEGSVLASPVLDGEAVIVATLRGIVYRLSLSSGEQVWRLELGKPVFGTPLVLLDSVLVPSVNNSLYQVSREGGECRGSISTEGPIFSPPVPLSEEEAVFGCQDGHLYLVTVDQAGLSLVRKVPVGDGVTGSPDCEEVLACSTTAGNILLVEPGSGEVLHSHRLPGHVFSSPVLHQVSPGLHHLPLSHLLAGAPGGGLQGRLSLLSQDLRAGRRLVSPLTAADTTPH